MQEVLSNLRVRGLSKAVDFLARHYGIRTMRVVFDGRRARRGNRGCYFENRAYFTKRGLNKRYVLHEFYHHLVCVKGLEISSVIEERDARGYAREFLRSRYSFLP